MSMILGFFMKTFATRLKEERVNNNMTQKNMADLLNLSLRAYQGYEAIGKNHREPDQELLIKIATVLSVSVDYLLGLEI